MGILGMFKKKDEPEPSFDMNMDANLGLGSTQNTHDFQQQPAFENPAPAINLSTMGTMSNAAMQQPPSMDKDLQILSLKLDAIKAELDSMNQRLRNIEQIAEREQGPQKKWY